MSQRVQRNSPPRLGGLSSALFCLLSFARPSFATEAEAWRRCANLGDDTVRLACYDSVARTTPILAQRPVETPVEQAVPPVEDEDDEAAIPIPGCRDPRHSTLSRFWELEKGASCGTFSIRGYRPLSISLVLSDQINRLPGSPNKANQATDAQPFKPEEMRLQLAARTKLAEGLLTPKDGLALDSLWFAYSQQSYWQIFNSGLSRPFRSTDHEPELIYVYPTETALPSGWRLRYSGLGLAHHSNGRELPYSRSWNRVYAMAGADLGERWQAQLRLWRRLRENASKDDNPDISDKYGRGELLLTWHPTRRDSFAATARHALRTGGKGSLRLEWLHTLGRVRTATGAPGSALRLHTQIFSGYGDSLIDYNFNRTVLMIGLSLVDF